MSKRMEPREPKDADVRLRFERLEDRLARLEHVVLAAPSLEATHTPEQQPRDVDECVHDALIGTTGGMRCTVCKQEGGEGPYDPAWHLPRCPVALMLKYAALRAPVGQQAFGGGSADLTGAEPDRSDFYTWRDAKGCSPPAGQQDGLTALCEDAGPLGSAACMIRRGELDSKCVTLEVSEVAALARWLREPDYRPVGQQEEPVRRDAVQELATFIRTLEKTAAGDGEVYASGIGLSGGVWLDIATLRVALAALRHPSPVSPPAKSSDYANLRAIANEALANMEALVQRLAGAEYDALFVRPSDSDNPEPTVFAGEIWDVHPKSRTVSIKPDALPPEFWNSGTAPIGARVTVFVSEVQPTGSRPSAGGEE